ncbi:hypothetical protein [Micromonospora chersina]|uniref:hypothetical protein n=1 Tax=Micromonospora chersina TaxID=47854 RepID=UPI0037195E00
MTSEIRTDMRVRLPEQLGSAEGVAMFMDGSRSTWAVYVPGPKHPGNDLNDGFLVYCPPEWLEVVATSAPA